jgi:hypothetical protein
MYVLWCGLMRSIDIASANVKTLQEQKRTKLHTPNEDCRIRSSRKNVPFLVHT